jgi:colanic acid/amylovoran biosynthesis protein
MGRPFGLLGQTIGPFRRVRPWMRWVLRRAAFIGARDRETFEYLQDWRMSLPLELTADVAFLLEPGPREAAIEYLKSLGSFDPQRPLLGLTPSNLFNVRTVDSGSAETDPLAGLAEAVAQFATGHDLQITIIPHVFGPGSEYDDRVAARRLGEALLERNIRPLVVSDPLPPREMKAVIGCSDLLVSTRMHAVIGALSQRVPVIALAYSEKHHGLLKRMEMPECVMNVGAADSALLAQRIETIWNDRPALKERIGSQLEAEIMPAARRNFDLFGSVLESPTRGG